MRNSQNPLLRFAFTQLVHISQILQGRTRRNWSGCIRREVQFASGVAPPPDKIPRARLHQAHPRRLLALLPGAQLPSLKELNLPENMQSR